MAASTNGKGSAGSGSSPARVCHALRDGLLILLTASLSIFALPGGSVPAFAERAEAVEAAVAEPDTYRTDNYRAPVPATLKGARVIDVGTAEDIWNSKAAVFIDVYPQPPKPANLPKGTIWRTPSHESIAGAHWLANVGYGVLSAEFERYFREGLERLTEGDRSRSLVFFCLRDCWMSWNAARRALAFGYRSVIWFPEGTDGWKELGLPVAQIKPEP